MNYAKAFSFFFSLFREENFTEIEGKTPRTFRLTFLFVELITIWGNPKAATGGRWTGKRGENFIDLASTLKFDALSDIVENLLSSFFLFFLTQSSSVTAASDSNK